MNLNDFDITTHSGLYISKDEHPIFGKKYIARFQYDKKRYVKLRQNGLSGIPYRYYKKRRHSDSF